MKTSSIAVRMILGLSFVILLAVGSFGTGILAERHVFRPRVESQQGNGGVIGSVGRDSSPTEQVTIDRIEEMLQLLDDEYFYGDIDREERLYDALEGLVNGLPDDYTVYLPPEDAKITRETMSGQYEGIGIWIDTIDGALTVVSPMKGSPAEAVGILAGDIIVAVDGTPVNSMTQEEAVRLVRGPAGTPVHLTIKRADLEGLLEFDVERANISTPAVTYTLLDGGLALVSVTVFGDKTTEELDRALQMAADDGATGIILDLRNNGGGWVNSAQEMVGRFISRNQGPAFYEDHNPNDDAADAQPILEGDVRQFDIPLAVLVNGGTASASEIVVGALQDYNRATIIGTKTFGKGSIQRVHQFDDGSSARITIAEWLTPEKRRIQGEGLIPDIEVAPAEDTAQGVSDPQLERAVEFLLNQQ